MCGPLAGSVPQYNATLGVAFALKNLLWTDQPVAVIGIADPAANHALANTLLRASLNTPDSRARLALTNVFGDIPVWGDSLAPRPADPDEAATRLYLNLHHHIGTLPPFRTASGVRSRGQTPDCRCEWVKAG